MFTTNSRSLDGRMEQQTVDPDWPDPVDVRVAPGATIAWVSGLGGNSVRDQERCLPTTYPYGCNVVTGIPDTLRTALG